MLTDYWLLSDLDGTLIATPHKANGRYLPITQSPCFEPIKQWLLKGGNVCIVTTADVRVIDQVYHPLRRYLKTHAEYVAEVAATLKNDPSSRVNNENVKQRRRGCLLLSLYTGAVLYWCTADDIVMLPGYASAVHCATRESVELAAAYQVRMSHANLFVDGSQTELRKNPEMCVRGTCINASAAHRLQTRVEELYFTYVQDVLTGTDPTVRAATKWLSQRYQRMWGGLLQYLDLVYNAVEHKVTPSTLFLGKSAARTLEALITMPASNAEAVAWKMQYLRSRRGFLTAVGILRMEYVASRVTYNDSSSSSSSPSQQTEASAEASKKDKERAQLVQYCMKVLLADIPPAVAKQVSRATNGIAEFLIDLLGPNPADLKRQMQAAAAAEKAVAPATSTAPFPSTPAAKEEAEEANIAQVILLGMPLRLFSRYFRAHVAELVRGGVNAMPQPNSVVFSKIGVSKSTALRYLLGKDRVASVRDGFRLHFPMQPGPQATPEVQAANFAACVLPHHGIALGDNPQSTDYELTVFRDVPFLSVEKESQRVERQRRILRRLDRTQSVESRGGQPVMPDGSRAPSYVDLVGSLRRSGPMMDDRLFSNINYIGAEEEGTALFLSALVRYVEKESKAKSGDLSADAFHDAVARAQGTSRDRVILRTPPSKL